LYVDGIEKDQEPWTLTAGQSVYFGAHSVNDYIVGLPPSLSNVVFGPAPPGFTSGTNFGDYLYWSGTNWVVGDTQITLGKYAGQTGQGYNYTVNTSTTTYTSSQTFNLGAFLSGVSAFSGYNIVTVQVIGGGGAGAGSGNLGANSFTGFGGNSGQVVTQTFFNAGGTIPIVVGAGGTPGGTAISGTGTSTGGSGSASSATVGGTAVTASGGAGGSANYFVNGSVYTQGYLAGQNVSGPAGTFPGGTNGSGYGSGGAGGYYVNPPNNGVVGSAGRVIVTVRYLTNVSENTSASSVSLGENAGSNYQGTDSIAIGKNAGNYIQARNSVAIGDNAGQTWQSSNSVAIGYQAGQIFQGGMTGMTGSSVAIGDNAGQSSQGYRSVAIGYQAGQTGQGGVTGGAVAIGDSAGQSLQGYRSVAIGYLAGQTGTQDYSVAVGSLSKSTGYWSTALGGQSEATDNYTTAVGDYARASGLNSTAVGLSSYASKTNSIAIGPSSEASGENSQAIGVGSKAKNRNSIAIGGGAESKSSGGSDGGVAIGGNTVADTNAIALGLEAKARPGYIVLNASGANLNPDTNTGQAGFFTTSVRNDTTSTASRVMEYNPDTKEITYRDLLPKFSIIMWNGLAGTIPAGWILCDGNNDTPNMSQLGTIMVSGAGSDIRLEDWATGGLGGSIEKRQYITFIMKNY